MPEDDEEEEYETEQEEMKPPPAVAVKEKQQPGFNYKTDKHGNKEITSAGKRRKNEGPSAIIGPT